MKLKLMVLLCLSTFSLPNIYEERKDLYKKCLKKKEVHFILDEIILL